MSGGWASIGRVFRDGLRIIAPHGTSGIVAILLAIVGVGGLVLKADPIATFAVVTACFIGYAVLDEREYRRRVEERLREFTTVKQTKVEPARKRLTKRLKERRDGEEPLLFDGNGDER